jgi:choline monooxygenase
MPLQLNPAWLAPQALETASAHFSDEVQHEDIAICELVQQRLGSGSYFAGRLNPKRESGVHHFHELYRQALRA